VATAQPFKSNPVPLGVLSGTAGTPKQVTSNFSDLLGVPFRELRFQALVANTGIIYILNNSSAADTTNYTNVVLIIDKTAPGNDKTIPSDPSPATIVIPSSFWVDWATSGDKVIITAFQE
jgi:hypothetical protein